MPRAFVFPGQGSQAVGMGRALRDSVPAARAVFDEVDDALGEPLSRLIFEGPAERLTLTENAQPALLAVSLAAARALEALSGRAVAELCDLVAGHSLGEYSALAAVGALAPGDAARLLRRRGLAMQAAVPVGVGAMAAIMGLEPEAVEAVAAEAAGDEVCAVANDNAPGQLVVSGHAGAVGRAVALAKARGARRSAMLPVSAPFHCPLMAPAAEAVAEALGRVTLRAPAVPVVANVTAAPVADAAAFADLLVRQVTGRVRWRESVLAMGERGVGAVVELGAGRVLAGLARRTLPDALTASLQTPEDIEAALGAPDGVLAGAAA
ncbi:MAG TPA: ACP S-malonyltransferase [Geminicoccaceae bacterium]|nr:ACP S-malonyltransferase [Geminicoccaceae bacterium]